MRPFMPPVIEHRLHLVQRLEPGPSAFEPEMLVEERAVQALDATRPPSPFNCGRLVGQPQPRGGSGAEMLRCKTCAPGSGLLHQRQRRDRSATAPIRTV